MSNSDQALINAYLHLRIPADRIAAFSVLRRSFLDCLPPERSDWGSDDDLIWRLLQLRKSSKLPPLNKEGR